LLARHLRMKQTIAAPELNLPRLKNVDGNIGVAG
jgi:S-sulfosulfanyl-L-cysteine sulfohydrolase